MEAHNKLQKTFRNITKTQYINSNEWHFTHELKNCVAQMHLTFHNGRDYLTKAHFVIENKKEGTRIERSFLFNKNQITEINFKAHDKALHTLWRAKNPFEFIDDFCCRSGVIKFNKKQMVFYWVG
jgi:hypothetical protein